MTSRAWFTHALGCATVVATSFCRAADTVEPLRVLLVAGGCCHDYATQSRLLEEGIESRVAARVDVATSPDTTTRARFDIFSRDDWDRGYDVVIHDECSADVTDREYVARILAAHRRGTPAVNIHCAMHCYRWGDFTKPVVDGAENAGWYEMIGLQSATHGPQLPIEVVFTDRSHPVTKPLADWTTIKEELYDNIRVLPTARVIASGRQARPERSAPAAGSAESATVTAAVAWTNEYGPNRTRIFSTSLGHNNETVADDRYLDLVARGLMWAAGRLGDDGSMAEGSGTPEAAPAAASATP